MYSAYSLTIISHVCALCTRIQLMLVVQSRLEAVPGEGSMGYGPQETFDSRDVFGCLLKVVLLLESREQELQVM